MLSVQKVKNGATIKREKKTNIHPLLWKRVPERIQFRLCFLAYHCVHGTAPAYLAESLRPTSEVVARRCLRSVNSPKLLVL